MNYKFNKKIFFLLLFSHVVFSQEYDGILPEDVHIKLHVMMCSGNCPTYELMIYGNGKLEYKGVSGVKKRGFHQKVIAAKEMARLMSDIINAQYFTRSDESHNCFADISYIGVYKINDNCLISSHGPLMSFDIKFGDKQRVVHLSNYFSDDYNDLKNNIINIAGIKRWVKKR